MHLINISNLRYIYFSKDGGRFALQIQFFVNCIFVTIKECGCVIVIVSFVYMTVINLNLDNYFKLRDIFFHKFVVAVWKEWVFRDVVYV